MSFCLDLVTEDSFYENITLGITKVLESDPRISKVNVERRPPCERMAISSWEQRHSTILPDDLKNFYSSTDGFLLVWSYKYSGMSIFFITEEILPVGSIMVNRLNELTLTTALKNLMDFSLTRHVSAARPILHSKSKLFELDTCKSIGKVCLVHTSGMWSIWLITRDGKWGFLADDFTHYFRMSLVHLGLPCWQAAFAKLPLIPWAEQLFLLLAPHLIEKKEESNTSALAVENESCYNQIDPNIFKISTRQHKNREVDSSK